MLPPRILWSGGTMRSRKLSLNLLPTVRVQLLHHTGFKFLRVFIIPHLCEGLPIVTKVLKEVSIFMKDRLHHHLNGGGVVSKNVNPILHGIIHTISGSILIPQGPNTILKGPTLCLHTQVCFAPFNCFAYNHADLMNGHLRGGGFKVYHTTKLRQYFDMTKTICRPVQHIHIFLIWQPASDLAPRGVSPSPSYTPASDITKVRSIYDITKFIFHDHKRGSRKVPHL